MKVKTLQQFLLILRSAISAADGNSSVPADLEAVSAGLAPFAELDFAPFAFFLKQAEQYRSSGAVAVPSLGGLEAEKVQQSIRTTAALAGKLSGQETIDPQQVESEREQARQQLEQALTGFLNPLAIKVTLKGDPKAFKANLTSAATRSRAARVRAALEGATDGESLNAPERQQKLRAVVEGLSLQEVKAVAAELGAPTNGRTPEGVLSAIVERLTGIKPAGRQRAPKKTPTVDQAAVQQQAVKLQGLVEKSLNPGGLSQPEIESALAELEPKSVEELKAVAKEVGLEKPGRTKKDVLATIRAKLQEAEQALKSVEV
jgi:hypothetical protein